MPEPSELPVHSARKRVTFDESAVALFRRASHDSNPLHHDADYARRTPFGTPIVFGVLGVLAALSTVASAGPVRLRRIKVRFPGPLLPGVSYEASCAPAAAGVRLLLSSGSSPKVEVIAQLERSGPHPPLAVPSTPWSPPSAPLSPALGELAGLQHAGRYAAQPEAVAELDARLGLALTQLPPEQLQALLWVSFCCGMLVPGRQSLIAGFVLTFSPEAAGGGPLSFQVDVDAHSETGALQLKGHLDCAGAAVADVKVDALLRPDPVAFSREALVDCASRGGALRGRRALVTGGNRGLGAYLAGALCLQGAEVHVNYRSGAAEAATLRDALAGLGPPIQLQQADVTDAASFGAVIPAVVADHGLDLLVHNASRPIRAMTLSEQGADGLTDFVRDGLLACVVPTLALLPELRRASGCVLGISSGYTASAPALFTHYVAAKSALEGVLASLAREERSVRFVVARPPKLLTDQTNTNFSFEPPMEPAQAAARIVEHLLQPGTAGVLSTVDSF